MAINTIHHITRYDYDQPVKESVNEIRIYPFADARQEILHHEVNITGHPEIFLIKDYWGNKVGMFNLLPAHPSLVIESKLLVKIHPSGEITFNNVTLDELRSEIPGSFNLIELSKSLEAGINEPVNLIVQSFYRQEMPAVDIIETCGRFVYENFTYIKGVTNVDTSVKEILDHRSGVCQDFAHVMLEILRSIGIPCRYVSGYICPGKNGMRGEGATHAWVEAWLPRAGWIGYDPTNNSWVNDQHVRLAVGRNFIDCTPVKGSFRGTARQSLATYVAVGSETGHVFEDPASVKMEISPTKEESVIKKQAAVQQQQ
jgi:transglutaminase-like putative cysteine protease